MGFPDRGLSEEELGQALGGYRAKDTPFLSGRILGSMCTAPHPAALAAWEVFADTNLGDPHINQGTAELEREVVTMLGTLVGARPDAGGLFLSGATEANIVAMRLARDTTERDEIVMPETGHFSFRKAAHALRMKVVTTPVTGTFEADVEAIKEAVTARTAAVIGVAGNTEFGAVDDLAAIAHVGEDAGAWVHVDAAYGGFILPFLEKPTKFGLDVPGVSSVCLDPHKMGRAPVPAGALLVRDADTLAVGSTETPYVSTSWQAGLLSTRPGAAAAATWAALHAIGRQGYEVQARGSVYLARWFAESLTKKGYELAREPGLGILAIKAADNVAVRDKLGELGWRVSLTTLVPGIRVVCMPHVTSERLTEFLRVLPKALKPVGKHVRA